MRNLMALFLLLSIGMTGCGGGGGAPVPPTNPDPPPDSSLLQSQEGAAQSKGAVNK